MKIDLQELFNKQAALRKQFEATQKELQYWRDRIDTFIMREPKGTIRKVYVNGSRTLVITDFGISGWLQIVTHEGETTTAFIAEDLLRAMDDIPDFLKNTLNYESVDTIKALLRQKDKQQRKFKQVNDALIFIRQEYGLTPEQISKYQEIADNEMQ